tara:strand:- start:389 stop:733 length:345 start_codon:yes stop_codon:yes gene_type:complete
MGRSKTLFTLVALLGLTTAVIAETKYTSIMTGVSVGKGRVHIWEVLTKTFKASQIRIKKGEEYKPIRWATIPSYVTVTFTSKNDKITRSQVEKAVKAPPESKERYLVWRLEKVK